jgi:hypothetical protein
LLQRGGNKPEELLSRAPVLGGGSGGQRDKMRLLQRSSTTLWRRGVPERESVSGGIQISAKREIFRQIRMALEQKNALRKILLLKAIKGQSAPGRHLENIKS